MKKSRDKKDKKDKKDRVKSKFTTNEECLFKTAVPPNVAAKLSIKDKETRGKAVKQPVLVHEFEKTTKHATFLKTAKGTTSSKRAVEFVEGLGWVDEDGTVVEEVKSRKPVLSSEATKTTSDKAKDTSDDSSDSNDESEGTSLGASSLPRSKITYNSDSSEDESASSEVAAVNKDSAVDRTQEDDSDSSSEEDEAEDVRETGNTSEDDSSDDSSNESSTVDLEMKPMNTASNGKQQNVDSDSPSTDSSSEEEDETSSDSESDEQTTPKPTASSVLPASASKAELSIVIPPNSIAQTPQTVHPLEELYKGRGETDTYKGTTFSLANNSDIEESDSEEDTIAKPPMTPHTARDLSRRSIRSPAPTPDTAHPSRRSYFAFDEDNDNDDYEGSPSEDKFFAEERKDESTEDNSKAPESDFQKWFWENRGEVNRGWKKRRKIASKEKRQKENRRRGEQKI